MLLLGPLQNIYNISPVLLQNFIVTVYGRILHRRRYGGKSEHYTEELLKSQWYGAEHVDAIRLNSLKKIIEEAGRNVSYYRKIFRDISLKPARLKTIDDLSHIPLLDKETLRKNPDAFINEGVPRNKIISLYTSGTTGAPMKVCCSADTLQRCYAFWNRLRTWNGTQIGSRRATFGGRIIVPSSQNRPPLWRYDSYGRNMLFSSYHLSENNLPAYCEKIMKWKPEDIVSYPSSLYVVSEFALRNKLKLPEPKSIITTAETLLQYQREKIEEAFHTKITDQYSCTEMALFVSQCKYGSYHVHPEFGIVEILDEDGKPCETGKPGEVVCTSFINTVQPLIRYRLGDTMAWSDRVCGCGRTFPTVATLIGRKDDMITAPDGRKVGRLDPIFKGYSGIREAQIIQDDLYNITLKYVPDKNFTASQLEEILWELRERVGPSLKIHTDRVTQIPREKNSKFRAVISKVRQPGGNRYDLM